MPIVISKPVGGTEESTVAAYLEDKEGKPTLQAKVLENFIDDVDFDDVFEALASDPECAGVIESEEGWIKWDAELECYVEAEKGEEGAELGTIQTINGDVLSEVVDLEDMESMFDYHMTNEHDASTLQGKLEAAVFSYGDVDEETLDEFKKGDFKKVHKGAMKTTGGTGPKMVNRMLGAMIAKQAIKRAKASGPGTPKKKGGFTNQGGEKGAGYRGGDYEKHGPGYGDGTEPGQKVWMKYVKRKAAELKKKSMKIKGKKAAPKEKKVTKKAVAKKGAAALAKKVATKGKGKKLESTGTDGASPVNESQFDRQPATRMNRSVPVVVESHSGAGLAARMSNVARNNVRENDK